MIIILVLVSIFSSEYFLPFFSFSSLLLLNQKNCMRKQIAPFNKGMYDKTTEKREKMRLQKNNERMRLFSLYLPTCCSTPTWRLYCFCWRKEKVVSLCVTLTSSSTWSLRGHMTIIIVTMSRSKKYIRGKGVRIGNVSFPKVCFPLFLLRHEKRLHLLFPGQ